MNAQSTIVLTLLASAAVAVSFAQEVQSTLPGAPVRDNPNPLSGRALPWQAAKRSAHETVHEATVLHTNQHTGQVLSRQHRYVQLGTGLNVPDGRGGFQPARAEFEITADDLEARHTAHKEFSNHSCKVRRIKQD